jgi:phosphatidylglycerol lysyltransferase
MNSRYFRRLTSLIGVVLFTLALWVLYHELRGHQPRDIAKYIQELPRASLLSALGITCLNYMVMTYYDVLALRYLRHRLSYRKIAFASFIGYAFSNNMGFGLLAGGSVRYYLYSAWGLSAVEVTSVVTFCTISLWLGFMAVAGTVFLFEPMAIPTALHFPFLSVRVLGLVFVTVVAGCLIFSVLKKKPFEFRNWKFRLPSASMLFAQLALASMDWLLAAGILYVMLPSLSGLSFVKYLGIYLLAQTAGLVSQVPGGLGVFETVFLLLLSNTIARPKILAALLLYRALYYLFPLLLAVLFLGVRELSLRRESLRPLGQILGDWGSAVIPRALAFATLLAGALLLFSGAIPSVPSRIKWLRHFVPIPLVELSHFMASLVGAALLLVARGLQRRLNGAYLFTVFLLGLGITFSLLKGFDYEEALILTVILGAIFSCRHSFYRKSSLFTVRFDSRWIATVVIVLICTVWLGFFSYRHVEYSGDLWWRFTLFGDAPRFLRATVGVFCFFLLVSIAKLIRPAPHHPSATRQEEIERVEEIVHRQRRTSANLAFLGDKRFFFNAKENAFIMYSIAGRSWITMGDPNGPAEEWPELVFEFSDTSDHLGGWPVFYEVEHKHLDVYRDVGLGLVKLGEEARVPLVTFALEGSKRKGFRYTRNKLAREGCTFEVLPPGNFLPLLPELQQVSDAWLAEKATSEKGFSLGFFKPEYLKRFSTGIVRQKGKILAFVTIWEGAENEEISCDLMRHLPKAPHGVMDYMFLELLLWSKQQGYRWFNLGMTPLAGLGDHSLAPLWDRLGTFIFRHGEHFYNFQGVRHYKEKFDPVWEPKYLAFPGRIALPRILLNLASLISGGLKGIVAR